MKDWETRNVERNNISPTLDTRCDCLGVVVEDSVDNLRIRKLTPKECFRLMGVKDEDSDKLNHLSNATKYHLAGDSIVVNVLQAIFKSILIDNKVVDDKPIRLIEFFAGYGSQVLALKYLGINFEHWKICEWAINSIDAYKHIHFPNDNNDYSDLMDKDDLVEWLYNKGVSSNWNEPMTKDQIKRKSEDFLRDIYNNAVISKNLINIQQTHASDLEIKDRDRYNYIVTYSFPCQDLSLAGKGKGMSRDSGTRSGMLWEVERILKECGEELPQILLMENVPQVVGKKNKDDFDSWVSFLESKGYTNKYCMLNAKEVGYPEPIPQNRNRCFMISVLNPKCDIVFPEKQERTTVLKDLLEDIVDEKYYLSDKLVACFNSNGTGNYPRGDRFRDNIKNGTKECANTIITTEGNKATCNFIIDDSKPHCIIVKNATKQGYLEAFDGEGVAISSRMHYHRGNVQKDSIQTITTSGGNDRGVVLDESFVNKKYQDFIEDNGYIPNMFNPYHTSEIKDISPTVTTQCGSTTSSATVLITEDKWSDLD